MGETLLVIVCVCGGGVGWETWVGETLLVKVCMCGE